MNSDDVNDRKLKLSNIIQKITDSQLMKIREADNDPCRQEVKFPMISQERDNEMKKAISIKMVNIKEQGNHQFAAPVGFNAEAATGAHEVPENLPVGPGVTM